MNMSYSLNPNLPKVRADAVKMVRSGKCVREVARHFGYSHSAIVKWCQKVPEHTYQYRIIPTESSRPHHHPSELDEVIVDRILELRHKTKRGAEFIHLLMNREGINVSLSSVKRTLKRHNLTKYSKWKKWHYSTPRPIPEAPGLLVETDTVHDGPCGQQLYIYTLIDIHSRWAYAEASKRIKTSDSVAFLTRAIRRAPFKIETVQTDHGSEFSTWFTKKLLEKDITHRHTRIRTPNDNAHLERFNRTIQEECIQRLPRSMETWQKELPDYLHYYNFERPHMGIDWLTPVEKIGQVVPRY